MIVIMTVPIKVILVEITTEVSDVHPAKATMSRDMDNDYKSVNNYISILQ